MRMGKLALVPARRSQFSLSQTLTLVLLRPNHGGQADLGRGSDPFLHNR